MKKHKESLRLQRLWSSIVLIIFLHIWRHSILKSKYTYLRKLSIRIVLIRKLFILAKRQFVSFKLRLFIAPLFGIMIASNGAYKETPAFGKSLKSAFSHNFFKTRSSYLVLLYVFTFLCVPSNKLTKLFFFWKIN
jgi:hypothetical protein